VIGRRSAITPRPDARVKRKTIENQAARGHPTAQFSSPKASAL